MNYRGVSHGHLCNAKTRPSRCKACKQKVFYFTCDCGSSVFFDSLGGNWPEHQCMNAESTAQRKEIAIINIISAEVKEADEFISGGTWMHLRKGMDHWFSPIAERGLCGTPMKGYAQAGHGPENSPTCHNETKQKKNAAPQQKRNGAKDAAISPPVTNDIQTTDQRELCQECVRLYYKYAEILRKASPAEKEYLSEKSKNETKKKPNVKKQKKPGFRNDDTNFSPSKGRVRFFG
ncbi:MAG: hypothetical protein JWL77_5772 [Chthonomonadaceae bacterium]|nr:hypothetical protein [Chthonomonadaceae bacterium]